MAEIRQHGIVSFCSLPLTTARRRIGTLAFGRHEHAACMQRPMSSSWARWPDWWPAVENALNFDDAQGLAAAILGAGPSAPAARRHQRTGLHARLSGLIEMVSSSLQRAIPHEFTSLALREEGGDHLVIRAGSFKSGPRDCREGTRIPIGDSPFGQALSARRTVVFNDEELRTRFLGADHPLCQAGIRSLCCVPLMVRDHALGTLNVGSLRPDGFTPAAVAVIEAVAGQVAMAVANALAFERSPRSRTSSPRNASTSRAKSAASIHSAKSSAKATRCDASSSRQRSWRRRTRRS